MRRFWTPCFVLLTVLVLGSACTDPATTPPTNQCSAGAACVQIDNAEIRSCQLLFVHSKSMNKPTVGFSDAIVGEFESQQNKLALSFVFQKDEGFDSSKDAAVIRLTEGVADLKLEKTLCFNRKGAAIDSATVKVTKP